MNRRPELWLGLVSILFCSFTQSVQAQNPCGISYVQAGMYTTMGTSKTYVFKSFSVARLCHLTMFMNVTACFPGGQAPTGPNLSVSMTRGALSASRLYMSTDASCGWQCDCGPGYSMVNIVINGSDGLPVELMSFEVGGDDSSAGPEEKVRSLEADKTQ